MKKAIAMTAVVAATVVGISAPAAAGPPTNGCATENRSSDVQRGLLLLSVAALTADGYRGPGMVDDPANGGNADGFVCGIPSVNFTRSDGSPLYFFLDNQLGPVSG